jgi:hypothetical protein
MDGKTQVQGAAVAGFNLSRRLPWVLYPQSYPQCKNTALSIYISRLHDLAENSVKKYPLTWG